MDECKRLFTVTHYERKLEPKTIKNKEGKTISWGVRRALSKNPSAEIIYHTGDIGKEPMILIFGENPQEVVGKVMQILDNLDF